MQNAVITQQNHICLTYEAGTATKGALLLWAASLDVTKPGVWLCIENLLGETHVGPGLAEKVVSRAMTFETPEAATKYVIDMTDDHGNFVSYQDRVPVAAHGIVFSPIVIRTQLSVFR